VAMALVAHQIAIVMVIKRVAKLAKIADIVTLDTGKFQKKNHSHHHDGNGKKLGDRTGKLNLSNSHFI
jgi:hypothetical protein